MLDKFTDERGVFVKTFQKEAFKVQGLKTEFSEEFNSRSKKNVLRGLHFQLPPHQQVKVVQCVSGAVMDVVVDLRVGSPTYRQGEVFQLHQDKASLVYIPEGMAHGFYAITELAVLCYKVSAVYAPQHDTGILWSSAGIPWPTSSPILSIKDQGLPAMKDFNSPFVFNLQSLA